MKNSTEISRLLKQKEARRRRLAKLSFEEKIEIVERLRVLKNNRNLMRKRPTREGLDEYVRPEEMTHP